MKNRKITTGFIIIGLFISALTLLAPTAVAKEETRAGSVNNVGFKIIECTLIQGKYGLGYWEINVTFTVAGDSVNNAKIKVEVTSPNTNNQANETPGGTYLPGNHDVLNSIFNFSKADTYTVKATVSYDGGGPATHQDDLIFQEVVDFTIDNITLYEAPYNAAGEFGILMAKPHIISADITNIGNHKCSDISSRSGTRQEDEGLTFNVTVKTGGNQENVQPGESMLEGFKCPEPGATVNLVDVDLRFEWRPSKEATFTIEIKVTDACTDTTKTGSDNVVIKNSTQLAMDGVKTEPMDSVLQGEVFDIIVDLNTSGSNCDPMIEVGFEIKDDGNNVVFKNNITQAIEPMAAGGGGGGTSGASAIMPIYFTDVTINDAGTYTIFASVTDPVLSGSTNIEVTQIANDPPVILDMTNQDSLLSLRKDDPVYFKLKFTDTLYAENVHCWVGIDEGDLEMTCQTDEYLRNYTAGEIFEYEWSATGGENNYTMKVTDGILNVSTNVFNFHVLDVPPGYGMIKGVVRNETSSDPISGATVKIENKANGNTTEVLTNETGHYQAKLVYGVYKIQVSKAGYNTTSTEFSIADGKDVEEKNFLMSAEGVGPTEYGYLEGYVKTVDVNGSEHFIGGASIKLSGADVHWGESENGTGEYLIKPMSIGIPVGTYQVLVKKTGYKDIADTIVIKAGQNRKDFDLVLKGDDDPDLDDSFVLTIIVLSPYDAQVHIDGNAIEVDISGMYYLTLARGPHYVEVIKSGYETYKNDEIDLLSNSRIEVTLKKLGGDDDEDDDEPPVSEDSIKIKDSNGNPVVGAVIEFKIGNDTYTATTDSDGIAKFNRTIPKGTQITITTKDGEERPGTVGDDNIYTWMVESKDPEASDEGISPTLIYIIIGIVVLVVIFILVFIIIKKKGSGDDDDDDYEEDDEEEYEEETRSSGPGPSIPAVTTVSMGSCTKCGTVVPQGTTFCPQCGNNMKAAPPATLQCRGCGTQVKKGVGFCPNCGMNMTQGQLPVAGMQPGVPQLPQQTTVPGGFGPQAAGAPPVQQQQQQALPPGPAQSSGPSLDDLMASATVGSSEPPLPPPPE